MPAPDRDLQVHPLTPERWDDLTLLFGKNGAQGGCWCMWWRLSPTEYKQNVGTANREAFQRCVRLGPPPGLLAYLEQQVVGWCSLAPRETLRRIPRSTTWKPVDQQAVWSLSCFYVAQAYRGQGIATKLLHSAIEYARAQGVLLLEAYPKDSPELREADRNMYFGTLAMFQAAGFVEVARRQPHFPIMRLRLG
jgi:GNAT superfamily N-acetyltransferase